MRRSALATTEIFGLGAWGKTINMMAGVLRLPKVAETVDDLLTPSAFVFKAFDETARDRGIRSGLRSTV